ncbi:transposase [Draconibacterium mangrovi]|uniref:transposase n=1 Tax=Draconibacterium mangrovi TaxID=2697469 RepID=UPI0021D18B84|nr:transposase [Draconibacterium mangrovi]
MGRKKQNKTKPNEWSKEQKIASMKTLEQLDFNFSHAAKELGVSRQTLYKWKELYWELYLENREHFQGFVETAQAKQLLEHEKTDAILADMSEVMQNAVRRLIEDPNIIQKMSVSQLLEVVNKFGPYTIPKKGAMPPPGEQEDESSFFTDLLDKLKKK